MKIEAYFYSHPIFRLDEVIIWGKEQGKDSLAIKNLLKYYLKTGHLLNIRRGVYAVVSPHASLDTVSIDPYLIAAKATTDSVLAYHTALELHGAAYSVFEQFTFLSSQKTKPFLFDGQHFKPVSLPVRLKGKNRNFGIETIDRQGIKIRITNSARTFVDVLDRIELSGGWEEVIRGIDNIAVLDTNSVINYCLMLNNRTLNSKVGFFLEQRKGAFKVSEESLKPLLKKKPLSPQFLVNKSKKEKGSFIKKWNLILPLKIIRKEWEEPNHDV